jgi:hypothetical protein
MKANALRTACLAVGLATAWGSPAGAQSNEIQLTISPSNNLTHVYFIYGVDRTSLNPSGVVPLPDVAAGTVATDTFFVPSDNSDAFTLLAVYDETNNLLTFAFPNPAAPTIMARGDFNTQFAPYMETSIATALMSGDAATFTHFVTFNDFDPLFFDDPGYDIGTLINFSGATDGGSILGEIIPEPSPILLVGFGMLAILAFHAGHRRMPLFAPKGIGEQSRRQF